MIKAGHITKLLDEDLSADLDSLHVQKAILAVSELLENLKFYGEDYTSDKHKVKLFFSRVFGLRAQKIWNCELPWLNMHCFLLSNTLELEACEEIMAKYGYSSVVQKPDVPLARRKRFSFCENLEKAPETLEIIFKLTY